MLSRTIRIFLSIMLAGLLFASCSNNNPVAPNESESQSVERAIDNPDIHYWGFVPTTRLFEIKWVQSSNSSVFRFNLDFGWRLTRPDNYPLDFVVTHKMVCATGNVYFEIARYHITNAHSYQVSFEKYLQMGFSNEIICSLVDTSNNQTWILNRKYM